MRTVTIEKRGASTPVVLTGRIEAEDNVALGFRIAGRIAERDVNRGNRVEAGQVVARLESQDERNTLRSAQANLAAAEGQLVQARNHFERQETLLARDVVSQATFDEAKQAVQTAQSRVDAAKAQQKTAQDLVGFTELAADAPGIVTEVGPAAGEVVQAGQMIVRLARQDGRDAVFDMPAQLVRSLTIGEQILVSLRDDATVSAHGRIREIAAQANPATRTFEVRIGLTDPPAAMPLGATVTGRLQPDGAAAIEIPASALTHRDKQPVVWVVDPSSLTVSMRDIAVRDQNPAAVAVASGLAAGDIVITAGVHALHQGQKIRLLGSEP
ncbi:MAG TPA: efflux RND transporter periplasmic adaptor subunit [Xanthobacteraceae bacterium]|nr:efflux RND transporter periplasmic adaptor subunit [Xanthobacteraceae bacterium]